MVETLVWLRERGIRLGGTTGCTRAMMDVIEPLARAAGITLEAVWCADEVSPARPAPWACFRLVEGFGIYPMGRGLKIGDTAADMAEGRSAGMGTPGITATGNEMGLDAAALAALRAAERIAGWKKPGRACGPAGRMTCSAAWPMCRPSWNGGGQSERGRGAGGLVFRRESGFAAGIPTMMPPID